MTITGEEIVLASGVLAALISFGTIFVKIHRWIIKQEQQDKDIQELRQYTEDRCDEIEENMEAKFKLVFKHHDDDVNHILTGAREEFTEIKTELQLLTRSVLACLKGLRDNGSNGPVVDAIKDIESHLNETAHSKENLHSL